MKNRMKTLAVATLVVVSALSMAQGRGGGMRMMGGGGGMSQLLARPDVQAEIKLTDEQKGKLDDQRQAMRDAMRQRFQNGGGASSGTDREAMMKEFQEAAKKAEKEALAVLDDKQKARLKELWIQREGNNVVTNEDIQKELGFSEEQKGKVKSLQDASRQAMSEIFQKMQNGELDRSEMQPLMEKNQKAMSDELGKVMTADQAAKLKAMRGAEFKFDEDGN